MTTTDSSPPLLHCHEGVATITLNRPEKRNALAMPMMLELTQALREVGQDVGRRHGGA